MALVSFGGGILEMRGSIGANTFARNKSGAYVRARTKPINPNTDRQSVVRANMSLVSKSWFDSASGAQRIEWETFAKNMPETNKLGQVMNLSGFNQFVRSNLAAKNAGFPSLLDGPASFVKPGEDPLMTAVGDEASQEVNVTFDDNRDWVDIDEAGMIVQVGIPQNPSVSFFNGPWRHAGVIEGDSGAPPTTPATIASPWPIVENQRIWVRCSIILDDGRLSDWFQHNSLVVA